MKTVYGWVISWGNNPVGPRVTIDLFFSSRKAFDKCLGYENEHQLVAVEVVEEFDELDFIPDNY